MPINTRGCKGIGNPSEITSLRLHLNADCTGKMTADREAQYMHNVESIVGIVSEKTGAASVGN